MNNKKGEISEVGVILTVAVAVIIGLVLFQSIANNVDSATRTNSGTLTITNGLYTSPATNAKIELTGQELVGTPTVTNRTDGSTVPSSNYSIAECVRTSDGLKGICFETLGLLNPVTDTIPINITYSYYPDGYIDDAGSRSIFGLVTLLAAIGIAMVVLAGSRFDF